jgi:hypothetical protein
MSFYSNAMKRDRHCHILRFLHFTDKNEPDRKDEILTDWKTQNLFEIPNRTFSKFYNHSQHVAIYEVIGLYKGRVIFRQYIPKKRKHFFIKIYKTVWGNWLHIWHENTHGEGNTAKGAWLDHSRCDSDREITRMWPQIVCRLLRK